jgi:hypothetical protein
MNVPCSAFICRIQGTGKSYTLPCFLENAYVPLQLAVGRIGHLTSPGLAFWRPPEGSDVVILEQVAYCFECGRILGTDKIDRLIPSSILGPNPRPLIALVCHYDEFGSSQASQLRAAAYMCSQGITVRVIVSDASFHRRKRLYWSLPGLPAGCPQAMVVRFCLFQEHLSYQNMKILMNVRDDEPKPPSQLGSVRFELQ